MKGMKRCNKCRELKPLSEYHWADREHTELHPWCKACLRVAGRASRLKKLEHYQAKNRAWNQAHYEEMRAYQKAYYYRVTKPRRATCAKQEAKAA